MRKLFFLIVFMAMALPMMAQDSLSVDVSSTSGSIDLISRNGNTYYYQGQVFKRNEMENQLYQLGCQPVFRQYSSGNKMARVGWGLLGAGLGLDVAGLIVTLTADISTGQVISTIGGLCETVSVPLLIVGYSRMHDAVENYNMYATCARPRAYWSITSSRNGLGIAYNF